MLVWYPVLEKQAKGCGGCHVLFCSIKKKNVSIEYKREEILQKKPAAAAVIFGRKCCG